MMTQHYPFMLPPLKYPYDSLEPFIDERTMRIHHDVIFRGYIDRLNTVISNNPVYKDWNLITLLTYANDFEEPFKTLIKNNAGGVLSHYVYFESMTPIKNHPHGILLESIKRDFGSVDALLDYMTEKAYLIFGSGNVWLMYDTEFNLRVIAEPNSNTPPLEILRPLLVLDVWEHAYFLKHYSDRRSYLRMWRRVVNWNNEIYLREI